MTNAQQAVLVVETASMDLPQEQLSWTRALVGFTSSLIAVVLAPIILASF
jgi:hypothetical protein